MLLTAENIYKNYGMKQLVDDVIAQANLPAGKVLAILTMLQIKGLVKLLPGNRVERI